MRLLLLLLIPANFAHGQAPAQPANPTPLSAEEKADILLSQAKLNAVEMTRDKLSRERDQRIEQAIRRALEEWYHTANGAQFGQVNAEVERLRREVSSKLGQLGQKHGAAGHSLDTEMNWKKP